MHDSKIQPHLLEPPAHLEAGAKVIEEPSRRWWIWLVYALLFGASVPWYLPTDSAPKVWLGLPHWVIISLMATIAIALFTAFVVNAYWREKESPSKDREGQPS